MNLFQVNSFFGDMDLQLMDYILKGKIPDAGNVLDVGCGEGRNSIFFIQNGYHLVGLDKDASKISLLKYMGEQLSKHKPVFQIGNIKDFATSKKFDLILCSRVLHFASSVEDFFEIIDHLASLLASNGIIYISMDSIIDNDLAKQLEDEKYKFPDGKIRFPLTENLYSSLLSKFEEVVPATTTIYHGHRAQSFLLLKKLDTSLS